MASERAAPPALDSGVRMRCGQCGDEVLVKSPHTCPIVHPKHLAGHVKRKLKASSRRSRRNARRQPNRVRAQEELQDAALRYRNISNITRVVDKRAFPLSL